MRRIEPRSLCLYWKPWPRQHIKERLIWGLQFRGWVHKNHEWECDIRQAEPALEQWLRANIWYKKKKTQRKNLLAMPWALETLKIHTQWLTSFKAIPPFPSKAVPWSGNQKFKYMNLRRTFIHKSPHGLTEFCVLKWKWEFVNQGRIFCLKTMCLGVKLTSNRIMMVKVHCPVDLIKNLHGDSPCA